VAGLAEKEGDSEITIYTRLNDHPWGAKPVHLVVRDRYAEPWMKAAVREVAPYEFRRRVGCYSGLMLTVGVYYS